MDERLREYAVSIYPLYVMGAEDEYGSSAIVVISEQPGVYDETNPVVAQHIAEGYKLVDANMFGISGALKAEFLTFVKKEDSE